MNDIEQEQEIAGTTKDGKIKFRKYNEIPNVNNKPLIEGQVPSKTNMQYHQSKTKGIVELRNK